MLPDMESQAAEPNGIEPQPDGTVTIVIRLTPTPNGYAMNISADPATVFPDTVIEACGRAIRTFERMLGAQATVQTFQGNQAQVSTLNRERERIRRTIVGGLS